MGAISGGEVEQQRRRRKVNKWEGENSDTESLQAAARWEGTRNRGSRHFFPYFLFSFKLIPLSIFVVFLCGIAFAIHSEKGNKEAILPL